MRFIDGEEVRARLTYPLCIEVVRKAMIALSAGETRQLLRSIIPLADGAAFGIMPGALGERSWFGAKLISVYPQNPQRGLSTHQGVVVLFEPEAGRPVCIVDAAEVTAIRTAAASAVATDALARPDATRLAILGCGEQAETHARAMPHVRPISAITVWGRSAEKARGFAARMARELDLPVEACPTAEAAVADADIVCTVTASDAPILLDRWVKPGTHLNLVGSSRPGPVEIDDDLVVRSRFIADYRAGVLAQGAEVLKAKAAGRIGDDHVAGEIGQVLSGVLTGRQSADEVTAYKSLGHVVQDLAAAVALFDA